MASCRWSYEPGMASVEVVKSEEIETFIFALRYVLEPPTLIAIQDYVAH